VGTRCGFASRRTPPAVARCDYQHQRSDRLTLRILFAGTPATALPSLDALLASPHEVIAVLTRPDAPAGRGRHETRSSVALRAAELGIETLQPRRPSEPEFGARLAELAPDAAAIVAYGALIPQSALEIPTHGWINLHFSLLPAWRGAAPVQHAILHGDEITGATTFVLEAGLDTGPVLGVLTEAIRRDDTSGTLLERLSQAGAGLLVNTLDGLEAGLLEAVPQPGEGISLAPKITSDDARVDWSAPARHVDRLIRACSPAPGAWTTLRDRRVKLGSVRVPESVDPATGPTLAPGEIAASGPVAFVGTATTPLLLGAVQPEGKAPMPASDWLRGVRLTPGEAFA
jgi:methionyl-tRNA formyltransferase